MKPLFPFLLLFGFLSPAQTSNAQITEGAISFETKTYVDWDAYERESLKPQLDAIEQSDMPEDLKKEKRAEAIRMYQLGKTLIAKVVETVEVMDLVFSNGLAGAERSLNGAKENEFTRYVFDSMNMTRHYIDQTGTHRQFSMKSPPAGTELNWSDIRHSVRIDTSDTKEILGFKCVKYYVEHSHRMKGAGEITRSAYEMYVTDAFELPLYLFDPILSEKLFSGAALEIKYFAQISSGYSIVRATSFSRDVDRSKLDLPERFRK
ncbi:MAG: hypothetical protein IPJ82_23195 [Lewinellaceae bacterium]|nr:hypothetical protein [Lewinellaceae bacterium]